MADRIDELTDDEIREYIDHLHKEIQWLETNLKESEQQVLQLKQELQQSSHQPVEHVDAISRIEDKLKEFNNRIEEIADIDEYKTDEEIERKAEEMSELR